jgi:hypothetical protein
MAISLSGTSASFFNRIGKYLAFLDGINVHRGTGALVVATASRAASTTVTVTTLRQHGFEVGDTFTFSGSSIAAYNGSWTVVTVTSTTVFTYTSGGSATDSTSTLCFVTKTAGANLGSKPYTDNIFAGYTSSTDQQLTQNLYSQLASYQSAHSGMTQFIQQQAQALAVQMAADDSPQPNTSLLNAIQYIYNQMVSQAATVNKPTISTSVTIGASNVGMGASANTPGLIISILGKNGLQADYLINETLTAVCTADGQSGATAGKESFLIVGPIAENDPLNWDYPLGSGSQVTNNAVDATVSNDGENLLVNSAFASQTSLSPAVAPTPDFWNLGGALVNNTDIIAASGANVYKGVASIAFVGNAGGTGNVGYVYQNFNSSAGTPVILQPNTVYVINFALKGSGTPAAGVMSCSLTDQNNAVVNDPAGNPNTITVALSTSLTTSFKFFSGFFRTPLVNPATGYRIRIGPSTAISTGTTCYTGHLSASVPNQMYPGGPYVQMMSGTPNFIKNDTFGAVINTLYNGRFQQGSDKLFNMKALGIQWPSSGGPTIADNLIA